MTSYSTDSRTKSVAAAVVWSLGTLMVSLGLVSYLLDVAAAYSAAKWPTAEGQVVSSRAVRGCGKGSSYYPEIIYRYAVEGMEHVGRRIAFGESGCGSESSVQLLADRFPSNSAVKVYFNPQLPSDSVLIVGAVSANTWLCIALMSFFLIWGVCIAAKCVRQWL